MKFEESLDKVMKQIDVKRRRKQCVEAQKY